MINRIVGRCHVGDSLQDVIRYVISRFEDKFDAFRSMSIKDRGEFVRLIASAHNENRNLYNKVVSGKF